MIYTEKNLLWRAGTSWKLELKATEGVGEGGSSSNEVVYARVDGGLVAIEDRCVCV